MSRGRARLPLVTAQLWDQEGFGVRLEWGPVGAAHLARPRSALVVIDVLCFTTCVSVAVGRGTAVRPAPWRDGRAAHLATRLGAALAVGREDVTSEQPYSLSPAHLLAAPPTPLLVLPSPNGSTIAAAATTGTVVAACLRNASAVADWLVTEGYGTPERPVVVVPAGERWPDGSLRPSLEDLLGAAAVVSALVARVPGPLSPEAAAVPPVLEAVTDLLATLRECGSGRELVQRGWAQDVDVAAERDADRAVPVLVGGAFIDRAGTSREPARGNQARAVDARDGGS
jgi:2-phosphosulfolactate phosphatase